MFPIEYLLFIFSGAGNFLLPSGLSILFEDVCEVLSVWLTEEVFSFDEVLLVKDNVVSTELDVSLDVLLEEVTYWLDETIWLHPNNNKLINKNNFFIKSSMEIKMILFQNNYIYNYSLYQ